MSGVLQKHELRKSFAEGIPQRHHDIAFGDTRSTTTFDNLFHALQLHFGEMELIARREYERGYHDAKQGRPPTPWMMSQKTPAGTTQEDQAENPVDDGVTMPL